MKKVATIVAATGAEKKPSYALADRPHALSASALLALHQQLQGSLCIGTLISHFFAWLGEQVPVAGIEYVYPEHGVRLACGESRQHRAHYVLRLEQRYLGEISMTARTRMPELHLSLQEQSMGVLVHYIKNALDHLALEKVAYHDSLTGVMNRTALDELLPKEVDRAQRYEYDLSVAMIDIDHFKSINDQIGHLGADQVLCNVSRAIQGQLRSSDLTFRYGGDEFLVILPGTSREGARTAARQIMVALGDSSVASNGQEVTPGLSMGVVSRQVGESADQLLLRADNALYEAKKMGRNCIC